MSNSMSLSLRVVMRKAGLVIFLSILASVFLALLQSHLARAQSADASPRSSSQQAGSLVVTAMEVREKVIQFGDALDVIVRLENKGKNPITIPPGALILKNEGWSGYPGGGSGLGESALEREGAHSEEAITLQPGESVTLTGVNSEMAAKTMGPMRAGFIIETEDESLEQHLGKPEVFSLSYYVAPSKLIASAWAAKTPQERQRLQPQVRHLLLLGSKADGWRDRFYVEGTLTFLGCYALPLLEAAQKDSDPVVREQAAMALSRAAWGAGNLNFFIAHLIEKKQGQEWAAHVGKCDENHALKEAIKLAIAGLNDRAPRVRVAAISVLTERAELESSLRRSLANSSQSLESMDERTRQMYDSVGLVDPALPLIQKMAGDADAGVRSAAQKFLSNFAAHQSVAGKVAASLADPNPGVRNQALQALKSSHDPPPMAVIEQAFASVKGEIALGLIELMYEREDAQLPVRLSPGFKERTAAGRLMILTAIAGHADDAALNLVSLGLKDADERVQRAALMRLLEFPAVKAVPLIRANSAALSPSLLGVALTVEKELESRSLFPFLARAGRADSESIFPSREGTQPMVSPDRKWVAYVETGWGRPGGSGGMGRSNLISLTHVARSDGSADRVVSDMFLVGWMSDSRGVASARDGFAAIADLNGKVVTEFGDPMDKPYTRTGFEGEAWPAGNLRHQLGVRMPHSKGFHTRAEDPRAVFDHDYGEDAAFSPDGEWFGPRRVKKRLQFIDPQGNKIELEAPEGTSFGGWRAVWSPDGSRVVLIALHPSNSLGESETVELGKAFVIDFAGQRLEAVIEADRVPKIGNWDYRKGRWNLWSRDGRRLAYIRRGQVWTSDLDGTNARQLTFDSSNKVFPAFSPDGSKIAYITWQYDNRLHYKRLGPTDIWIVDCKSGLAARATRADLGRIEGLDWIDEGMIIFDRLDQDGRHSTLRRVSLR